MVAQVKQWGNGQGIRLTKDVLEMANIHIDEYLNIEVKNDCIILSKTFRHKTLEERAREFDGKLEHYEEHSWGNPKGEEVW